MLLPRYNSSRAIQNPIWLPSTTFGWLHLLCCYCYVLVLAAVVLRWLDGFVFFFTTINTTSATIEVALFVWNGLRTTGLFNSKSWEKTPFFSMILVVYLGHGIFHLGSKRFYFRPAISFWVKNDMSWAPKARNLRNKMVHLYRSTRIKTAGGDWRLCVCNFFVASCFPLRSQLFFRLFLLFYCCFPPVFFPFWCK